MRRWIDEAKGIPAQGKHAPAQSVALSPEQAELQQLRRENQMLRMEREILKKSDGVLRQGIDVTFRFVQAQNAAYPVTILCGVLEVVVVATTRGASVRLSPVPVDNATWCCRRR